MCGVLTLALLVARVFADDHNVAVATDDLALVTDLLDAGVYLHDVSFSLSSYRPCSGRPLLSSRCFRPGLLVAIHNATASEVVGA